MQVRTYEMHIFGGTGCLSSLSCRPLTRRRSYTGLRYLEPLLNTLGHILFGPKGTKGPEEIILDPFPDPEARDRESAIPKIQRPFRLAIGKCILVIKGSRFTPGRTISRWDKSISAWGLLALVHIFRFVGGLRCIGV